MGLPTIISDKTITFYIDGRPYQASATTANFDAVKEELKKPNPDTDRLIALVTPAQAIIAAVAQAEAAGPDYLPAGTVSVTLSEVRYNGEPIEGVLVDRILALLSEGFDIMPMVRFLENLYRNPADHAREELYLWLEKAELPITEDGHFLAYKLVRSDFKSQHDGKTDNTPGTVVSMPRQQVDPVRDRTCSRGLHFCSKDYLPSFGYGRGSTVVLLKINPADVVSIPSDYSNTKGRAWKYEVLQVVDHDPMNYKWASVVSADGGDYETDGDEDEETLSFPSALSNALFGHYQDAELGDREDRLAHASSVLDLEVTTFYELSEEDARTLIEALDAAAEQAELDELDKEDEATRIHDLGIIELPREASQAGLVGAGKGYSAKELRDYLLARI